MAPWVFLSTDHTDECLPEEGNADLVEEPIRSGPVPVLFFVPFVSFVVSPSKTSLAGPYL
jgi:hypothetical protein